MHAYYFNKMQTLTFFGALLLKLRGVTAGFSITKGFLLQML